MKLQPTMKIMRWLSKRDRHYVVAATVGIILISAPVVLATCYCSLDTLYGADCTYYSSPHCAPTDDTVGCYMTGQYVQVLYVCSDGSYGYIPIQDCSTDDGNACG